MARRVRSVLAKLRGCRDGSVAAEFGMIAPLFFALSMGGIEYGSVALSASSMQLAANVAAREVAVNRMSEAAVTAKIQPYLPGWMAGNVTVEVSESHPTEPRINVITITMTAPASSATPIAMFTKAMSWTVSAEAHVQQEMPFDTVAGQDDGGDNDGGGDDDGVGDD